jgi:hypothetical protein
MIRSEPSPIPEGVTAANPDMSAGVSTISTEAKTRGIKGINCKRCHGVPPRNCRFDIVSTGWRESRAPLCSYIIAKPRKSHYSARSAPLIPLSPKKWLRRGSLSGGKQQDGNFFHRDRYMG